MSHKLMLILIFNFCSAMYTLICSGGSLSKSQNECSENHYENESPIDYDYQRYSLICFHSVLHRLKKFLDFVS